MLLSGSIDSDYAPELWLRDWCEAFSTYCALIYDETFIGDPDILASSGVDIYARVNALERAVVRIRDVFSLLYEEFDSRIDRVSLFWILDQLLYKDDEKQWNLVYRYWQRRPDLIYRDLMQWKRDLVDAQRINRDLWDGSIDGTI